MKLFNKRTLPLFVFFLLTAIVQGQGSSLKIVMIGNSTMADKAYTSENPEKGWGQILPLYFNKNVTVENYARNGRSTKSFIDEGLWDTVLQKLTSGCYLIIEFGHNDAKQEDPKRYANAFTAYRQNLERFINECRQKGAVPVLATPINRRMFDSLGNFVDTHGGYPAVVRDVALQMHVPLLDLHKKSRELFTRLGAEGSKKLFVWTEPGEYNRFPDGKKDDTHFNANGAFRICDLAVEEIQTNVKELVPYLKK